MGVIQSKKPTCKGCMILLDILKIGENMKTVKVLLIAR